MLKNKAVVYTGVGVASVVGGVSLIKYFKNKKELKALREKVIELQAEEVVELSEDIIKVKNKVEKIKETLEDYNNFVKSLKESNHGKLFTEEDLKEYSIEEIKSDINEFRKHCDDLDKEIIIKINSVGGFKTEDIKFLHAAHFNGYMVANYIEDCMNNKFYRDLNWEDYIEN